MKGRKEIEGTNQKLVKSLGEQLLDDRGRGPTIVMALVEGLKPQRTPSTQPVFSVGSVPLDGAGGELEHMRAMLTGGAKLGQEPDGIDLNSVRLGQIHPGHLGGPATVN